MMRTSVLSMVALALALVGAPRVVMAKSTNEAAVAQAVEAFRNAMLKADRGQLDALTAAQLSYGHSGGRVETKAQFIDAATNGPSPWKFITLTDQTTRIVGDTAIVRHTLTDETERDGQTTQVKIGVLKGRHKKEGARKRLASQAVRQPEAATN